jgi:parallel beta-helix repeat protein
MKVRYSAALAAGGLAFALNSPARGDSIKSVAVDCAAGDTLAKALTKGDERKPLLIQISGTCNESILIDRNDVMLLAGASGATIRGTDPAVNVIVVTASRVTIDGLTVTGGRNGITGDGAPGLMVRNTTVQGTGRTGINYQRGASGTIDHVVVQNNPRDGIAIESAYATVINSQINQNGRHGVGVFDSGAARIGVDDASNAAGNVINGNTVNGIHIVFGSSAFIGMNQISGNGNPTGSGINLSSASADILGGNTIVGNNGTGINLRSSSAVIGDAAFGLTTVNTISGNGNPTLQGGVSGFLGSSMSIRDAVISNNVGFGLILTTRSSAQIQSTTIQNNVAFAPGTGDGIRIVLGSALFVSAPNGTVTGNAGFGLLCTDGESSVINTALLGIGPNTAGTVSAACTGF